MPHVSPAVVHFCFGVLSYYLALVEFVAFGVEVLLAMWALSCSVVSQISIRRQRSRLKRKRRLFCLFELS